MFKDLYVLGEMLRLASSSSSNLVSSATFCKDLDIAANFVTGRLKEAKTPEEVVLKREATDQVLSLAGHCTSELLFKSRPEKI